MRDIRLGTKMSVGQLVRALGAGGGFTAKKVWRSVEIWLRMLRDRYCVKFLAFPACIVATGCRGVIVTLLKRRLVDVVITTCGALDHDIARTWKSYYHGEFEADDSELRRRGINRLGNIFIPNESYGEIIEQKVQTFLEELWGKKRRILSVRELVWEFGKRLGRESIFYWAWKNRIPVFIPGIFDGAVGSQLWLFWQTHRDFGLDEFKDQQELADIVFGAKRSGAIVVGGGISKHHTIWWNQFKNGLDYVIYITTAVEWDGSLSGARTREAVSWKKVKPGAARVTVEGDATVLLPLIVAATLERLNRTRGSAGSIFRQRE